MNINPYEAPRAAVVAPVTPPVVDGEPHQPWTPSEVIGAAWNLVKPYAGKAWVMGLVTMILGVAPIVVMIVAFEEKLG
ncbi:MAG: hypothetical protein ACHREM_28265, partial [Polyangiales bacterium]